MKDPKGLKLILQSVARFIRRAKLNVSKSGMRIRSIDPHDFCYVDVKLSKQFFEGFEPNGQFEINVDFSKVSKIVPYLTAGEHLDMRIGAEGLTFQTQGEWQTSFTIMPQLSDSLQFGQLQRFRYDAKVTLPARRFVEEIRKAAAVSHEVIVEASKDSLSLSSVNGDYSFASSPLGSETIDVRLDNPASGVSTPIILDYIKLLGTLIERAEHLTLELAEEAPLRMTFKIEGWGDFTFYVSHRRLSDSEKKRIPRSGESLPRISMTRFPEFCSFLATDDSGFERKNLILTQMDTKGGDYTRLAKRLGFARSYKRKLRLTKSGREFVDLFGSDQDGAKRQLHRMALDILPAYKDLVQLLLRRPMTQEEILSAINESMQKGRKRTPLDRQDLSTLLGMATWSRAVDRKLGLYYFGRVSNDNR